jgi:hypothetical protein
VCVLSSVMVQGDIMAETVEEESRNPAADAVAVAVNRGQYRNALEGNGDRACAREATQVRRPPLNADRTVYLDYRSIAVGALAARSPHWSAAPSAPDAPA